MDFASTDKLICVMFVKMKSKEHSYLESEPLENPSSHHQLVFIHRCFFFWLVVFFVFFFCGGERGIYFREPQTCFFVFW